MNTIRAKVQTYRDLLAWQKSMDFAVAVYELTSLLPDRERFGLVSQLQRSAISVPSNIAEGAARLHTGGYKRHLSIALGSLAECETQMLFCVRANLLAERDIVKSWTLAQETGRLIRRLIQALDRQHVPVASHQSPATRHSET